MWGLCHTHHVTILLMKSTGFTHERDIPGLRGKKGFLTCGCGRGAEAAGVGGDDSCGPWLWAAAHSTAQPAGLGRGAPGGSRSRATLPPSGHPRTGTEYCRRPGSHSLDVPGAWGHPTGKDLSLSPIRGSDLYRASSGLRVPLGEADLWTQGRREFRCPRCPAESRAGTLEWAGQVQRDWPDDHSPHLSASLGKRRLGFEERTQLLDTHTHTPLHTPAHRHPDGNSGAIG